MTQVINSLEMTYAGVKRFRGEIFTLLGLPNDEKLVRVGHFRVISGETRIENIYRDDGTGREFVDEATLRAYQRSGDKTAIRVKRSAGRPRKAANAV